MRRIFILPVLLLFHQSCFCWGFFAHEKINYYAVFLLPPQMIAFYKPNINFLSEHAVDPDKRRYSIPEEAPRHYIDLERYREGPLDELPKKWEDAISRFGEDSLNANGIVPWWTMKMFQRLTNAFKEKNESSILTLSAEIGHYISDAHVPLHACHNYNGQLTNQIGIHAFWESRIPELLADKEWDFFIGRAGYLKNPSEFIWARVMESGAAADTVLSYEKELGRKFPGDQKYAFEYRNEITTRQYSTAYSIAYNIKLKGMIERRMRESIYAVASFWYTAWVNAGEPNLQISK